MNEDQIKELVIKEIALAPQNEAANFRKYLADIIRTAVWILGGAATFGLAILGFIVGSTYNDLEARVSAIATDLHVKYSLDKEIHDGILERVSVLLKGPQVSSFLDTQIRDQITDSVREDASTQFKEAALEQLNTIDQDIAQYIIPSGTVVSTLESTAPVGWLLCDGREIPQQFETLRGIVGENTPDLRGLFLRGLDSGRGIDPNRILGSEQSDAIKRHQHSLKHFVTGGPTVDFGMRFRMFGADNPSPHNTGDNIGGGGETRPRNIAMNFMIKT